MKTEMVNGIKLDLTYYSGQDLYSDGTIEDEMLSIVQRCEERELNRMIREHYSWAFLYHFSHIRHNIVSWLPIKKSQSVLEIGSGCGAVTGALAKMADHVTCIELSKKRSLINANRNKQYDNIEIKVGNFTDIEPNLSEKYDYITLIGVFEYAENYIGGKSPYTEFLKRMKQHLKPDGRIVIAIENRIGMKYLAGCKEDHVSRIGEGLDHYSSSFGVRTFDKKELCNLFEQAGFSGYQFYYPYPDYKLPLDIYSDEILPQKGALYQNDNNLDQARMRLFDETSAFDKAIELGVFEEISNSFEVILNNSQIDALMQEDKEAQIVFAGFSNDRRPEYTVVTKILKDADGEFYITKTSCDDSGKKHVEDIFENAHTMQVSCEESGLFFPSMINRDGERSFSFVDGITLDSLLDKYLFSDRMDLFYEVFDLFVARIKRVSTQYINPQILPSNIMISAEKWYLMDCEWIYENSRTPVAGMDEQYVIYRALHHYREGSKNRSKHLKQKDFYGHFDLDDEKIAFYESVDKDYEDARNGDYYQLDTAKKEHNESVADANDAMAAYVELKQQKEKLEQQNAELEQQSDYIAGLEETIRLLKEELHTMENSNSWKITKPLRTMGRKLHRTEKE